MNVNVLLERILSNKSVNQEIDTNYTNTGRLVESLKFNAYFAFILDVLTEKA